MEKRPHALISDGKVESVRFLTEQEVSVLGSHYQNVIDVSDLELASLEGALWNGLIFTDQLGNQISSSSQITRLAFRQRFTLPEMVGIQAASQNDLVLSVLLDNLKVATFIDLKRQDTIQGVYYLVQQGLISLERAQEILGAPVQEHERFRGF